MLIKSGQLIFFITLEFLCVWSLQSLLFCFFIKYRRGGYEVLYPHCAVEHYNSFLLSDWVWNPFSISSSPGSWDHSHTFLVSFFVCVCMSICVQVHMLVWVWIFFRNTLLNFFRQSLPVAWSSLIQWEYLVSRPLLSKSGKTCVSHLTQHFYVSSGDWTQIHTLARQSLYWMSYLFTTMLLI